MKAPRLFKLALSVLGVCAFVGSVGGDPSSLKFARQTVPVGRALFTGPGGPVHVANKLCSARQTDADCAACHAEVAREAGQSSHASAWSGAFFQAQWQKEPLAACVHCHAPQGVPVASAGAGPVGLGCATCHVRVDGIVAGAAVAAPTPAPHAVVRDPRLSATEGCAGCHQFGFFGLGSAGSDRHETPSLQQATYAEWLLSPAGRTGTTCQACHMPVVARSNGQPGRSHAFAGRTVGLLAASLKVQAAWSRKNDVTELSLRLDLAAAGHAVPTGDQFRRIDVRLLDPTGRARAVAHLGRTWRRLTEQALDGARVVGKTLASDRRVLPGSPRLVLLRAKGPPGQWHYTLEHVRAARDPVAGVLECEPGAQCTVFGGG